jgi:hemerythrin-like metal-binding protein
MDTLLWDDAYTLGVMRMDKTHREFVELVARLEHAIAGSIAATDNALAALVAHTEGHFAQEERWMAALGFAPENCHTFQHAHVLQVLREVARLHRDEGDVALVRQLVGELAKWFPVHAQMMDAPLADMMAERGFDPDTGTLARPLVTATAPITGCGDTGCS